MFITPITYVTLSFIITHQFKHTHNEKTPTCFSPVACFFFCICYHIAYYRALYFRFCYINLCRRFYYNDRFHRRRYLEYCQYRV